MHSRLEDPVAPLAVALGHVHSDVCVPEQLLGLGRLEVLADEADPDARPREDALPVDVDREVERAKDARRRVGRVGRAVHPVEQHGEFVAPEACDGVGRTHGDLEPATKLLQDLVAGRMPEAVVDRLEVVEVDEHDRDLRDAAAGAHERVLDAV